MGRREDVHDVNAEKTIDSQNFAKSWLSKWEYSMFRGAAETTPAVLRELLEKLIESCEVEGQWILEDESKQTMKNVGWG